MKAKTATKGNKNATAKVLSNKKKKKKKNEKNLSGKELLYESDERRNKL